MNKFAGVGLKNLVLISLFVMLFVVMAKVITNKHEIPGVTEVVNAV